MSYRLGLDLGIGSVGWSVLKTNKYGLPYRIINLDSIVFQKGEKPDGSSNAAERRKYRSSRRLNQRRKYRLHRVRKLFIDMHLLTAKQVLNAFRNSHVSIYKLRVNGLNKKLSNVQLFRVLYYLAKHRGFKSNRKYARKKAGVLIKSIQYTRKLLKGYRTLGEMLYKSPKFTKQKRNHDVHMNGYLFSASRTMIVQEAKAILHQQMKYHIISPKFIKEYLIILKSQRDYDRGPSKPSPYAGNQIDKMIGRDTLDHTKQRGSKATFTFELFRLLNNLNNLAYKHSFNSNWTRLNKVQRRVVINYSVNHKTTNYARIKKLLKLDKNDKFNLVRYGTYKRQSTDESKSVFADFSATKDIQKCLPERFRHDTKLIDAVGEVLSKYSSNDTRRHAFANLFKLPRVSVEKLLLLNYSTFARYSLSTMRKLNPYLAKGINQRKAIKEAGLHPENKITAKYVEDNVKNPVVLRTFAVTRKLVNAVVRKYGTPDAINIELARDLNKPYKVRKHLQKVGQKFQKKNQHAANWLRNNGFSINGQNILTYSLYNEQKGIDPYTGQQMALERVFNGNGNFYNIDHIIPYSISWDDSYNNKVLTSVKSNEDKGNRTPLQWLQGDHANFLKQFAMHYIHNYKKRKNLLTKSISSNMKSQWKSRNLNDTRYLNRLIANYLEQNIKFSSNPNLNKERVIRSNGSMTAKLRHRWGLVKIRANGDLHHAMDATVIASITPAMIKDINDFAKCKEIRNNPSLWNQNNFKEFQNKVLTNKLFQRFFNDFPTPWPCFREELINRLSADPAKAMSSYSWKHYTDKEISELHQPHVVHLYSHRVRGKVRKDTAYSAKYLKQGLITKYCNVKNLTLKYNNKHPLNSLIKEGSWHYKNHKNNEDLIIRKPLILQMHKNGDSGKKAFPNRLMRFTDGNNNKMFIRHIKVFKKYKGNGVLSHDKDSIYANGRVIRIDLFKNPKNKLVYVPVYQKDTINKHLPRKIAGNNSKERYINNQYEFIFSLVPYTPIHIIFNKPHTLKPCNSNNLPTLRLKNFYGYFYNPQINNGAINLYTFDRSYEAKGVGIKSLPLFHKLSIDYLGQLHRFHNHINSNCQKTTYDELGRRKFMAKTRKD